LGSLLDRKDNLRLRGHIVVEHLVKEKTMTDARRHVEPTIKRKHTVNQKMIFAGTEGGSNFEHQVLV
jgi:hypothetical protein